MPKIEKVNFGNRQAALARIEHEHELNTLWQGFSINAPCPCLVIVGGASGMDADALTGIENFFKNFLAPFVQKNNLAIVDGGTNAGVMRAIGSARENVNGTFPLVGVIAQGIYQKSEEEKPASSTPLLDTRHSHFILTPGKNWGDEAPWISAAAKSLSGDKPSLTILLNGGDIAWQDAEASANAGRRVLVAAGSGRTADKIAETETGSNIDPRAVKLLATKLVDIENPFKRPEKFIKKIEKIFTPPGGQDGKKTF